MYTINTPTVAFKWRHLFSLTLMECSEWRRRNAINSLHHIYLCFALDPERRWYARGTQLNETSNPRGALRLIHLDAFLLRFNIHLKHFWMLPPEHQDWREMEREVEQLRKQHLGDIRSRKGVFNLEDTITKSLCSNYCSLRYMYHSFCFFCVASKVDLSNQYKCYENLVSGG